jgi:hypothetical protein
MGVVNENVTIVNVHLVLRHEGKLFISRLEKEFQDSTSGAHNEKGREGGKEREAPTHLIKIQNLPMLHALLKRGKTTRYLAKKK